MSMLRRLRDRLYSDPRFQRWAASFPLTRAIARQNAATVFDLTAGFVYSRVLEACLRLDVLEQLRSPRSVASLAEAIDLPVDGCERLLMAATGIELVEPRGTDDYGLGRLGAMVLGNPGLKSMVLHHRLFHHDLDGLIELLRGEADATELGAFWSYAGSDSPTDDSAAEGYSDLMGDSLQMLARDVLDAHPLEGHRHLMDVGGGDGSFLRAVAERAPGLELTLFDLPAVARRARDAAGAIEIVGGDVFRDPLPHGADCVSLVRILLDHEDEAALEILRAAHRALPPGGTLIIAEPMSGTGVPRVADTYFGLYLLAMGQGRTRTPDALGDLLRSAGFRAHQSVPARRSVFCHLIVATA